MSVVSIRFCELLQLGRDDFEWLCRTFDEFQRCVEQLYAERCATISLQIERVAASHAAGASHVSTGAHATNSLVAAASHPSRGRLLSRLRPVLVHPSPPVRVPAPDGPDAARPLAAATADTVSTASLQGTAAEASVSARIDGENARAGAASVVAGLASAAGSASATGATEPSKGGAPKVTPLGAPSPAFVVQAEGRASVPPSSTSTYDQQHVIETPPRDQPPLSDKAAGALCGVPGGVLATSSLPSANNASIIGGISGSSGGRGGSSTAGGGSGGDGGDASCGLANPVPLTRTCTGSSCMSAYSSMSTSSHSESPYVATPTGRAVGSSQRSSGEFVALSGPSMAPQQCSTDEESQQPPSPVLWRGAEAAEEASRSGGETPSEASGRQVRTRRQNSFLGDKVKRRKSQNELLIDTLAQSIEAPQCEYAPFKARSTPGGAPRVRATNSVTGTNGGSPDNKRAPAAAGAS